MANFDFTNFKEKVVETAGKVADRSVTFAKVAGDKAKLVGRITKLKAEITMEKDRTKKAYAEIGKLYYEKHRDNPDPDMAQAVTEVSVAYESVAKKKEEVDALKKQLADDFGEVVEDVKEDVEDFVDVVAEKVEDVVEEIVED